jgi:hypothetical protein
MSIAESGKQISAFGRLFGRKDNVEMKPASPDTEGDIRTGGIDHLPPLSEVRQIRDMDGGKLITHINGVQLRALPVNQELLLE